MGVYASVAAGLFAVFAIWLYLDARENELLQMSALQDVVVTTKDVLANTALDERMIQVTQVPRKFVQPGAVGTVAEVVGRVAAVPMPQGAQVTGTSLIEGGAESLAVNVPKGMRAIAIAVGDVTGVGGQLRPGNFVDVGGTFEYGVPSGTAGGQITYAQERTETVTIAQNVQVVSIGGEPVATGGSSSASEEETKARPGPPALASLTSVTLLVTPAQVQELVLAQQIGALTFSLRSSLDSAPVDLIRLDENAFLRVPMPLKPRSQPVWREMRGAPQR
jgi:pilus assembly protein CpaB